MLPKLIMEKLPAIHRRFFAACWFVGLVSVTSSVSGQAEQKLPVSTFRKIAQVDQRFQSYNVEMAEIVGGRFWAPYPEQGKEALPENTEASGGLALEANLFRQRPPADLTNRRLRNLAHALGPAYIRVSGSWANTVYFQDDDLPRLAKPPKGFQNVLTREQWRGVIDFANAVDGRITLSFPVSDGARDADGTWEPTQARKLLRYTSYLRGKVYAAELMNEPNLGIISALPAGFNPARFAGDIAAFKTFVQKEAPSLKTVGPGSTGEAGVPLFANRGISTDAMLSAEPRAQFDIFSYHFYGGRSQRCARMAPTSAINPKDALSEEWLGRTDQALAFYKDLRDLHMPGAPIWLNETAQASCGGDEWASSFLDSFRYVDQLGRLAKQGVSAVFHNTLAASDYALIDDRTMTPRPSYWAAVLWNRLMGATVLDAGPSQPGVHLFAHCLKGRPGGVALLMINLDRDKSKQVALPAKAQSYALTATTLESRNVALNGQKLALTANDRLPPLIPITSRGRVTLPPVSITFVAMPTIANRACR